MIKNRLMISRTYRKRSHTYIAPKPGILGTGQDDDNDPLSRIMWYIEWYSESPYELPVLYWCMRLLQVVVDNRDSGDQHCSLRDLFNTHGIIIIIRNYFNFTNFRVGGVPSY